MNWQFQGECTKSQEKNNMNWQFQENSTMRKVGEKLLQRILRLTDCKTLQTIECFYVQEHHRETLPVVDYKGSYYDFLGLCCLNIPILVIIHLFFHTKYLVSISCGVINSALSVSNDHEIHNTHNTYSHTRTHEYTVPFQ